MMNSADLRYYFSIFLRRLPLLLVVSALVTAGGLYIALTLPPVFRATGNILVESPQIPTELARSTVPETTLAQFQVIQQDLMTREALLSLATRFRIYPPEETLTATEIVEDLRARIGLEPIVLGGDQGALGFAISFEAQDPELAARVANGLVSSILERDAQSRSSRATDTARFFEEEVNRLGQGVAEIEMRLQSYKIDNLEALPDSLEFRRTQQSNQQDRLLILEREEASLRNRRASYVQLYQSTGRVIDNAVQTPEQKLLGELRTALITQRSMFADDSPNIAALQSRIGTLEAELRAKPDDSVDTQGAPSELDMQLADIDDNLQAITLEKASIERSFNALSASIQATPANETALQGLEREYSNQQTLYNAAVARLAEASTGEQIETRLKGEKLSLIEAALPPERPVRPKRFMIAAGGAVAGLGLGLALIVGLELLQGQVRRPVQLQRVLGIEPLATIPYIRTSGQIWKRRLLTVVAAALVIAALPAIQLVLTHNGIAIGDIVLTALARMGVIIS